ncbi:TPA: hypothetical protein QDB07_000790 [Burkholderia vietnamiensis]|nr:hypothetical protein [Burkholderia vietnamiensis]
MDNFDFNTLHDEHRNDQGEGTTSTYSADLALTGATQSLDARGGGNASSTDTPALTAASSKGKHGKKYQDEPAPAPAVEPVAGDVGDVDLSTPLAPTHDENKGFMRYLPPLLKTMNRNGVPFQLDGASGAITVDGFYKAGGITLEIGDDDTITAVDRRARTVVSTYDDLVRLNYDWWTRSNGRGENLSPDRPWLDAFLEKGWIKRVVIFVPRVGGAPGTED